MNSFQKVFRKLAGNVLLALATLASGAGCGDQASSPPAADDPRVLKLTKTNFQTEVLSAVQPVLVDFWAAWCGPCREVGPVVSELAGEFDGRARVGKVDVDVETDLAEQYKISEIPALFIFKNGKPVEQFIGVRSKSELQAALEKHLGQSPPVASPKS